MSNPSQHEILVVDDDDAVRNSLVLVLKSKGYGVRSSIHGLDALLQLRRAIPSVVISDLNMPQMSGFEFLSVVRRRFPAIPVIAMSGAYGSRDDVPGGVIADAFHAKGYSGPRALLHAVDELIQTSAVLAVEHEREPAPAWIPVNSRDLHGISYVMLTCTDCLRSFPCRVATEEVQKIQETPCRFCPNTVRYVIDFSSSIASPRPQKKEAAQQRLMLDLTSLYLSAA